MRQDIQSLRFLVVGCARSGTQYIARVLSRAGIPCGHEGFFHIDAAEEFDAHLRDDGRLGQHYSSEIAQRHLGKSTRLLGDASWLAVPFLAEVPASTVILHQVRDPLRTVSSLYYTRHFHPQPRSPVRYKDFAERHASLEGSPLHRCMRYWNVWNRAIERHAQSPTGQAYHRYRVETLDGPCLHKLSAAVGASLGERDVESGLSVPKTQHRRRRREYLDWGDLPEGEAKQHMRDLALRYGYEVTG